MDVIDDWRAAGGAARAREIGLRLHAPEVVLRASPALVGLSAPESSSSSSRRSILNCCRPAALARTWSRWCALGN